MKRFFAVLSCVLLVSAALSALSGDGTEDACPTDRDAEYLAVLRATLRMQDESRSLQASLGP